MTAALNRTRGDVPEELTSTVDTLAAALRTVTDPATTPQDREAVTESAKKLASALSVISDDNTPRELRDQLTVLVKQMTSTLAVGQEPDVPPEDGARLLVVVERTASALDAIGDSGTPKKLRGELAAIVEEVSYALEQSRGQGEMGMTALWVSSAMGFLTLSTAQPEETPTQPEPSRTRSEQSGTSQQHDPLAKAIHQVTQSMKEATDSRNSPEKRNEARKEMSDRTTGMKDEHDKAASEQEPPDAPVGKAAEVCTNAILKALPDRRLEKGLKDLTPSNWDSAGVKDFWKAKENGNEVLDVRAQLENDEHTHAPFDIGPLIEELAELLPGKELNATLGQPALHCRQTAVYLDQDGITAGSWLGEG
ncbi:hypothetical protein OG331_32575 [Streptomyces sp. NBC_01017]|uniref:hypothetical protein n=1 Tax=Streptomyces sp. NBC_01017 TaxID=2903721 RepID=UPI00386948D6|nr:hypothetical protein OG331_32575 [Streptomyces sp. NBC_01017]